MKAQKIRLTPYENGFGIKTEVDGVELQEVSEIKFQALPGELAVLTVSTYAMSNLDVEVDALVRVNLLVEGRCKECKHWAEPVPPVDFGTCQSPKIKSLVTLDEWGQFDTSADFGCVQWEAKP